MCHTRHRDIGERRRAHFAFHREPSEHFHTPWEGDAMHGERGHGDRGEQFGVRRPLRFLAHKLELDETQIAELARILDDLKIERAQVEVDDRRTLSEFADALGSETFDTAKASVGGERRVASAARLREVLIKSLQQIHAMLKPEQRTRLSYLIRTGVLSL